MSQDSGAHAANEPVAIEDYALLADLQTGPLVSRDGSIDWLCLPRFDSPAVFCHLLGDPDHSRWLLRPRDGEVVTRSYEEGTFILRTEWCTPTGRAVITEFMPVSDGRADVVRQVECVAGEIVVEQEFVARFDYGATVPWVRRVNTAAGVPVLLAIAGPYAVSLSGPQLTASGQRHHGAHRMVAGDRECWTLTGHHSYDPVPEPADPDAALATARDFWRDWSDQLMLDGRYADLVQRSLLVLRAMTHHDTGGVVAAPTTSLPETFGGIRNWDYRYCWLRDSALTLQAMLSHGLTRGAAHWRDWLLRAVAGDPDDLQIMYGIAGERQLPERELAHLRGYADSTPVRIGNGAVTQFQADVVGEVMLALADLRARGVAEDDFSWALQVNLLRYCTDRLHHKDQGLWEMRGEPRYFTHSRVMTWAAFDCGIRAVVEHGLPGPVEQWREIRGQLATEIEEHGFNSGLNSYVQTYDDTEVDASLLQLPHTGYLAYDDPRMLGTVARIEQELIDEHGLVARYRTQAGKDGLTGEEYPFLVCSFWLVEQYARSGRRDEAETLMDRLAGAASELGLYAEEYDAGGRRHAGNFPQAFSHLGLVRAADALGG